MEIQEYLKYRVELINESKDEDGFINESNFINNVIPSMLDAKLIDSEDFTETYYSSEIDGSLIKVNGYIINDSGERLQLFILNDESILLDCQNLEVSLKEYYESIFKKAINFTNKSIKGHLNDIQDIGAINALINQMSSSLGADQFDVVEIFLISATATIVGSGSTAQPKRIDFKDERIKIKYTKNRETVEKEILVIKRLVDLNFLYSVLVSQGNREALNINFEEQFNFKIESIKAADETNFESYLCVLPASILSELYKRFSSRLLEKNVRSFLQFRGVNLGMRKTLTKEPEKFIAFNNGLTITASNKEIEYINDKVYIKSLSDFQIVNGGQTTASIYFSQKDGIDISKVKVMAKINVAKDVSEEDLNELISSISEFSNSQSKVTAVDLRSRNPQLIKIKALSESVITPSGRKWFFEKSKGEFNTKLRISGQSGKNRIEKEYPKEFRFTKEQLGKYYCSWGIDPYKVKKGGEAIFRKFIENISLEESEKKIIIDRNFYELLISKIILFKSLEEIHGERSKAIGQLRSAVVPYTISILFSKTEGDKKNPNTFDLSRLWAKEGLEDDLKSYLYGLMVLINELIKKYAKSDDLGQYSQKKEMWEDILKSFEIGDFLNSENSNKIFDKYSVSKKDIEAKIKLNSKINVVDFTFLQENVKVHFYTSDFYKNLIYNSEISLTNYESLKFEGVAKLIKDKKEINLKTIEFTNSKINDLRRNSPNVFRDDQNLNFVLEEVFDKVLEIYNKCRADNLSYLNEFEKIVKLNRNSLFKNASYFMKIGEKLNKQEIITIQDIYRVIG
jgi:hypothetical protein